jgi:hypothetical protein
LVIRIFKIQPDRSAFDYSLRRLSGIFGAVSVAGFDIGADRIFTL